MPLPLDEAFRRIAIAKGDLLSSPPERKKSQAWYRDFIDQLTKQLQAQAPGNLAITHDSVRETIENGLRRIPSSQRTRPTATAATA